MAVPARAAHAALTQGPSGWYVFGAVLFFSLFINVVGAARTKPDAKLRTVFSEFR